MSTSFLPHAQRWIQAACCGIGGLILSTGSAYAADDPAQGFNFQVKGGEAWSYDSNPLRLVSGEHGLSGSDTTAELILGDYTPTERISADTTVDRGIYNNSAFDVTNFHEVANLFENNERWTAGVEGHADYDTARTSEITTFGVAIPSVRHTGFMVAPQGSFNFTSIDKLSLNTSMSESKYNNAAFTDYTIYSVAPSYAHNFDPNNAGLLIMNAQRYETNTGNQYTVDTIGPSLGWTSIINQQISTKLTAGAEESKQSGQGVGSQSSRLNYVFSGNIAFKGQQDTANFIASRTQQPYGNGTSALITSFNVDEAHMLNERTSLTAAGGYSYSNYPAFTGVNLKNQLTGSGGVAYTIFRNTDIVGNYQYIDQKLTEGAGTIKDQIFMVSLKYHPTAGTLY